MSNAEPLHSLLLLLQGAVGAKVDYFKLQQSTTLQQSIKKRKKIIVMGTSKNYTGKVLCII